MARKKQGDDWKSWALIVFFFAIHAWPVALILLLFKLFGSDEKKQQAAPPPLETAAPEQARSAAQYSRAREAVGKVTRSPAAKKSNAKWLKLVGAVVAVLGVLAASEPLGMIPYSSNWLDIWLGDFLTALAMAAGGCAMFASGISMDRSLKRYAKYLAVLGDREAMPVEELARTLGFSVSRVEKDLQKMIDKGYFGGQAYLNVELGYLFRSGEADAAWRKQQQTARQAPTPKEAEEGYSGILRNIRRANDAIADPEISAKIDRLEDITARIFRAVEADPKKRGKIDTFLNYYLPTTQKLLDSYAQFESAGVEGENLGQAKERIEKTMDSIVRGFEHQLDELYRSDAMDVDSDIRVMESMLQRDTATVARDFGIGGQGGEGEQDAGAAVAREE
jgi:hypothetical protein